MSLNALITAWLDYMDRVAPLRDSFDSIYIICMWLWLALGTFAAAYAEAKQIYAKFILEPAQVLHLTVTFLALGSVVLGFHVSAGVIISMTGGSITSVLFGRFVDQAQRWLTDVESMQYMHASFAVIITNGICCVTLIAS